MEVKKSGSQPSQKGPEEYFTGSVRVDPLSQLSMGMNTELTESGLRQAFDLIEENVSREQAEVARTSLAKIVAARQKK